MFTPTEDDLDAISRGESGHVDYLRNFYYGQEGETDGRPAGFCASAPTGRRSWALDG